MIPKCVFQIIASAVVIVASSPSSAQAVNACGAPPVVAADAKPNIFSPQQEVWLGEAERDMLESQYEAIHDQTLNRHVQELVDRLAKNVPEPHVPFHAVLVESSAVNGWSQAGGSIYLTRKLAATAKSDDELAGVLGHEMGHIASHQMAFEMTANWKRLLNVSSVGDRKDVYDKFHQWLDAAAKDKHPSKAKEDDAQDEADKVGIYLIAAAGFRPQALDEFFNRAFFLEGKTGGKLSDFFGLTRPDEKRLRGMRLMVAALPAGCGGQTTSAEQTQFAAWQKRVQEDQRKQAKDDQPLAAEVASVNSVELKLASPLQMEVNRLRFSPDGSLVLAQDDTSIYVLSRDPWKVLFRIDAERAQSAFFSPDSKSVTFTTPGLHTEQWDVSTQKLMAAHEPTSRHDCVTTKLSPDGRTAVCVSFDVVTWVMDLTVLDATSGDVLWAKKHFFNPTWQFARQVAELRGEELPSDLMWSSYSSDGNVLVIGPGNEKIAIDLLSRTEMKLGFSLRDTVTGPYAFLGSDRLAGVNLNDGRESGVFTFPEGKRLKGPGFTLPDMESLSDPGDKPYVLSRSIYGKPQNKDDKPDKKDGLKNIAKIEEKIAITDLQASRYLMGSRSTALDMWRDFVVTETSTGEVALSATKDGAVISSQRITLPVSPIGSLYAQAISPDGRFFAFSTRDRSGVWDLRGGSRLALLKPFSGARWLDDHTMVAEFEKSAKLDREIIAFDLMQHKSWIVAPTLLNEEKAASGMHYGYYTEWGLDKGSASHFTMHSLRDGSIAWSKPFTDTFPRWTASLGSKDLIFSYALKSDAAKNMIAGNSKLAAEVASIKKKEDGRVLEIVNADSGAIKATVAFELPPDYWSTDGLDRAGDQLYMTGIDNRVRVYSVDSGKLLWQVFGGLVALDSSTERACVLNRSDEAIVYDSAGNELLHTHDGERVRFASFGQNGSKLVLLLSNQTVRTYDLASAQKEAALK